MGNGPMSGTPDTLAITCPHCQVPPLERCRGPLGQVPIHTKRRRRAAETKENDRG